MTSLQYESVVEISEAADGMVRIEQDGVEVHD
ncbi:hypothetical protein BH20CHL3_BH20CHL3_05250 [soil metagenome]